jgi:hypothetical protein
VGLADHPHPHLADRCGQRQLLLAERADQAEVDVHDRVRAVDVEQVFAVRLRPAQHSSVHNGRRGGETALRAGDLDRPGREELLVQPGEPVQRVSLGHGR